MNDYQIGPTTERIELLRAATAVVVGIGTTVEVPHSSDLRKEFVDLRKEAIAFLRGEFKVAKHED